MFVRLGSLIGYVSDTPSRTGLAVAVCAVAAGCLELAIHEAQFLIALPAMVAVLLDAIIVGCSFGFAVWLLLVGNRDRRTRVRSELERIAELNHEVRNALQILVHSHFDADPQHRQLVIESVDRINSALKRLFPVVGGKAGV